MKIFGFAYLCTLLLQCQANPPAATTAPPAAAAPVEVQVLERFEQLEPYLRRSSDTLYVVNFWATWCKPCVAELPHFEELYEKYKDQKVKVLLVSLDFKNQVASRLAPFMRERNLQLRAHLSRHAALLRDASGPDAVWWSVLRAAPALGADIVKLSIGDQVAYQADLRGYGDRDIQVRYTVRREDPAPHALELGWADGRVDMDVKSAVDALGEHVTTALRRFERAAANDPALR